MTVQTDLTALRDEMVSSMKFAVGDGRDVPVFRVRQFADRLTAALGSLPVPENEELQALVTKWRERADVERGEMNEATDLETQSLAGAAWANIATCANELSALLSRSAQEPPKALELDANPAHEDGRR